MATILLHNLKDHILPGYPIYHGNIGHLYDTFLYPMGNKIDNFILRGNSYILYLQHIIDPRRVEEVTLKEILPFLRLVPK